MEVFVSTKSFNNKVLYPITCNDKDLYLPKFKPNLKIYYCIYMGIENLIIPDYTLAIYLIYTTVPFTSSKYIVYSYYDNLEKYKCSSLYTYTVEQVEHFLVSPSRYNNIVYGIHISNYYLPYMDISLNLYGNIISIERWAWTMGINDIIRKLKEIGLLNPLETYDFVKIE